MLEKSVQMFWKIRESGGVRANKHLDPLAKTIIDHTKTTGVDAFTDKANTKLPGRYRANKNWDIVYRIDDRVVAAVELKSMVGSFGNNMNNRAEEAIGNAIDLRSYYKYANLDSPWLGYVYLIEDSQDSKPYIRQIEDMCVNLVLDKIYDSALVIRTTQTPFTWSESCDLDYQNFIQSLKHTVKHASLAQLARASHL